MELYTIRGGNKKELEDRQYNIGVGISLGNKWFTPPNILLLTEWALKYTKEYVIVYVADSIHALNIQVRNRRTYEQSLAATLRAGDRILEQSKIVINDALDKNQTKQIVYAHWGDITNDAYNSKVDYLFGLYELNNDFSKTIHQMIEDMVKNEIRLFSKQDIHDLGKYLVAELPELVGRVQIAGYECDAYAYPYDGIVTKFAEEIQKGLIFRELRDKIMDTSPKVFLEVH